MYYGNYKLLTSIGEIWFVETRQALNQLGTVEKCGHYKPKYPETIKSSGESREVALRGFASHLRVMC